MQKSTTLLAVITALLCTLSCMKETNFEAGSTHEGYYEETVTVLMPETRTSFDNTTGVFSWSDGDEIAFHLSNGEYITAPVNHETGKVRLYIPEGVTRDNFAVYPASTVVTEHAEMDDMQLTLPDSYDISGALVSEYCPTTMLAIQDPTNNILQFNHAGGLVQLNLEVPAQTKTVKVEFVNRVVTGTIPVSENNTYYRLEMDDPEHNEEGGSTVNIIVSENGLANNTPVRINIPVPSGNYGNIKVTYNDGKMDTWEYTKETPFTLKRSGGKRISPSPDEFIDKIDYFHVIGLEDGSSVTFRYSDADIYYSTDEKKTWNKYTSNTTIPLDEGDAVYFYNTSNSTTNQKFTGTGSLEVAGLLQTLRDKDLTRPARGSTFELLFDNLTALKKADALKFDYLTITDRCCYGLFKRCTQLTTAPTELPATELGKYCYGEMFYNCSSLTTVPKLPATTLKEGCYSDMFRNCSVLTTTPELPAQTLVKECYQYMFYGCYRLAATPELPATTLAPSCYNNMFAYCVDITTAPELPALVMETDCYSHMFYSCRSLRVAPELPSTELAERCYASMFHETKITVAPELPATTLKNSCYNSMFSSCKVLVNPPELPATTLADYCYDNMFNGCIRMETPPVLPVTELKTGCYRGMLTGCSGLTTLPELPATVMKESCYESMFENCAFTVAPELPATTLAKYCYRFMFRQCSNLTTAPELPATTLAEGCYVAMFLLCTSLVNVPELPAPTLVKECYQYMFQQCNGVNKITCLATDISAQNCLKSWVNTVSNTGTFYKSINANNWPRGENGIPTGWTVYNIEEVDPQI